MPALANTTSRRPPPNSRVAVMARSMPSSRPVSATTPCPAEPRPAAAAATVCALRPTTTTRPPSATRPLATARPMPLLPPVTSATLPANLALFMAPFRDRNAGAGDCAPQRPQPLLHAQNHGFSSLHDDEPDTDPRFAARARPQPGAV